jgi:cobalt-zinc-cadmium resistance protein CzcA
VLGRDREDDLVQGIVRMRKGENPGAVIAGVKVKFEEIKALLPAGVEIRPYYDRERLVNTTVATVTRNLIEGAILVIVLLSLFLYNLRAAVHRGPHHPALAACSPSSSWTCRDPRQPALAGRHRLRDHRGRRRHHDGEHRAAPERAPSARPSRGPRGAARRPGGGRPLTFAVLIIMTVYVPILTFQRIEGKLFRPMAVTISLAVVGSLLLTLTMIPVLASFAFRRPPSDRESPFLRWLRRPYRPALRFAVRRPIVPIAAAGVLLAGSLSPSRLSARSSSPSSTRATCGCGSTFPLGISIEGARPYTRDIRERLGPSPRCGSWSRSSAPPMTAPIRRLRQRRVLRGHETAEEWARGRRKDDISRR